MHASDGSSIRYHHESARVASAPQNLTISARSVYRCGCMKILVIGGGGREHALVWKLRQGTRVEKVWCAPGNGGILAEEECFAGDQADPGASVDVAPKLGAE